MAVACCTTLPRLSLATTIHVSTTGSDTSSGMTWQDSKKTIAAALNAAVEGDQVWVAKGAYVAKVTLKSGVGLYGGFAGGETSLDQRNWKLNETIIDAGPNGKTGAVRTSTGQTSTTRIDGFTLRGGSVETLFGGGIACVDASPTIMNNTITGNRALNGAGIYCGNASPIIANNQIWNNNGTNGSGIYCTNSSPLILNNTIMGNGAVKGGAIYLALGSSPAIVNNTVVNNIAVEGGGVYCDGSSPVIDNTILAWNTSGIRNVNGTPTLTHNCVYNPDGADYVDIVAGIDDLHVDPGLLSAPYGDVHLRADSLCIDAGDDVIIQPGWMDLDDSARVMGAHVDIGTDEFAGSTPVFAPLAIRVSTAGDDANDGSSWALSKKTVQAAIDAVGNRAGEIWVAAGVYNESIALQPKTHVYGGFCGIENDRDERNPSSNHSVLDGSNKGSTVRSLSGHRLSGIDGFTLRNGTGTAIGNWLYGGEVFCSSSSPNISNNVILGGASLQRAGGGIYCEQRSAPLITGNRIVNQVTGVGGGIYSTASFPFIRNNEFTNNKATASYGSGRGGAIACVESSVAMITDNLFRGNVASGSSTTPDDEGAGAAVDCTSSNVTILNNRILESRGDGISCYNASVQISDNVIAASSGSAIFCSGGSVQSCNNTVIFNRSPKGAGLYCSSGAIQFSNNIVAFNYSGIQRTGATLTLTNNCVYNPDRTNYTGVTAGAGDISADPQLPAASFAEFHLASGSPCRDAGDDSVTQASWRDMDHESRVQGTHVDMGADEYDGIAPMYAPAIIRVKPDGKDSEDGSSWGTAKQTVQAAIEAASTTGGEVWVVDGVYPETVSLRNWVHVYGGFAGVEIFRNQRDPSTHSTRLAGSGTDFAVYAPAGIHISSLDGFTINDLVTAYKKGIYCQTSYPFIGNNLIEGSIECHEYAAPVIQGNVLSSGAVAGVYCLKYASPRIIDNTITGNGYGVYCHEGAAPQILDNTILRNQLAGVRTEFYSNPLIQGNTIGSNARSGIECYQSASPTVVNNRISGNIATDGGGIQCSLSCSPVIANNVIFGNSATCGGGICCKLSSSPTISNNTIVGNEADSGGGVYTQESQPVVSNTIIAFNSSGMFNSAGTAVLRNNCFYNPGGYEYSGLVAGGGDTLADPQLLSVPYGEVHLLGHSPCIDAGDDTVAPVNGFDLDGHPRLVGSHVDIGADESDGDVPAFVPQVVRVSSSGNDGNDGSTWALSKRTMQAGIDQAAKTGGDVWVAAGQYNCAITLRPCVYLYGGFSGAELEQDQRNWQTSQSVLSASHDIRIRAYAGYRLGRLDGFTIRDSGIDCFSSMTISNNLLTKNQGRAAVHCFHSQPIIENNRIRNNAPQNEGGGIYCEFASPLIANNLIVGNGGIGSDGGIYAVNSSPTIINNTIVFNQSTGIYITGSPSRPTIKNNIVAFSWVGISAPPATTVLSNNCVYNPAGSNYLGVNPGINDISADPLLVAPEHGEAHLVEGSPCIGTGDGSVVQPGWMDIDNEPRIRGVGLDMGADEFNGTTPEFIVPVIHVSPVGSDEKDGSSWALAKKTVQGAIDASQESGAEIWVAAGLYQELVVLSPWIKLYGGFAGTEDARNERDWTAHKAILDGGFLGSVVSVPGGTGSTRVDGFTLQHGSGQRAGGQQVGGAIYCTYASLSIANNAIKDNTVLRAALPGEEGRGGGVYADNSWIAITNNRCSGNVASHKGGAISCVASAVTISNNTLTGNTSTGTGGALFLDHARGAVMNNVIAGNAATNGNAGGIHVVGILTIIANNTIVGNVSKAPGAGITCDGNPRIVNNVVAFNSTGVYRRDGAPSLSHNCVFNPAGGNYSSLDPGSTDVIADPRLVDYGLGEVHLRADSPCIDAGSNADISAIALTDLDGHARFFDAPGVQDCAFAPGTCGTAPIVDMGAFEFISGDIDRDGDIDLVDLFAFQNCASGPAISTDVGCQISDLDGDGDADQRDFGILQGCYSGTGKPVDPDCTK